MDQPPPTAAGSWRRSRAYRWALVTLAMCLWLTVGYALWLVNQEAPPQTARLAPWTVERSVALAVGLLASIASAGFVYTAMRRIDSRREAERLAGLSEQKDHLLALVSHELRTPLTAVVGFLDELRERWDEFEADERLELLTMAGDEASEMVALVDDLLVGARLEGGRSLAVADGTLDMVAEVTAVVGRLPRARSAGVEVEGAGWARGDRVRIRQILRNVIDNAFKHGRPPVSSTVSIEDGECLVAVRDHGDGVPECCRESIFVVGTSAAGHGHPRVSSSNRLGLPVSAYLAMLMGGGLAYDVERRAFVLRLPAATPDEVRTEQRLLELLVG